MKKYDPDWPKIYEQEKALILKIAGKWIENIEHVGSTSIPNLSAKPTIDICIGVASLDIADQHIIHLLQPLGYEYLSYLEIDIPDRRYLQKLNDQGEHLVHIHIVNTHGNLWNNYLMFRDYLIQYPNKMCEYANLKRKLKEKFQHDRKAYTDGKANFIGNILSQAKLNKKSRD